MLSSAALSLKPSIIREMAAKKGPDTVDLTLGQPAWGPDKELLDRALQAYTQGTQGYTQNAGMPELRALIAEHHGCQTEQVLVTVGSEQAVYLAISAIVEAGDQILIPMPGYPAYPGICRMLGAEPVSYTLGKENGFLPDLEELSSLVTDRTKVMLVTTPCNPFGSMLSKSDCEALRTFLEKHNIILISDEIYRDITYSNEAFVTPCTHADRQILISGLSKSCAMTGFRLGYLIAPSDFVKKATLVTQLMVTCPPRIAQLMAMEVFKDPRYLKLHMPIYTQARNSLLDGAKLLPEDAKLYMGEGAFYGILDVQNYAKGDSLALAIELLEKENVAVVPGIAFGQGGDWFWRLSYASSIQAAEEGIKRICSFLKSL